MSLVPAPTPGRVQQPTGYNGTAPRGRDAVGRVCILGAVHKAPSERPAGSFPGSHAFAARFETAVGDASGPSVNPLLLSCTRCLDGSSQTIIRREDGNLKSLRVGRIGFVRADVQVPVDGRPPAGEGGRGLVLGEIDIDGD